MVSCYLCESDILTEADPHAFVFVKGEWKNNCGCYFQKSLQSQVMRYKELLYNHTDRGAEIERLEKELHQQRFNNVNNLSIDQTIADKISDLELDNRKLRAELKTCLIKETTRT